MPRSSSGCTTHPDIAILDNKMTESEHLSKKKKKQPYQKSQVLTEL